MNGQGLSGPNRAESVTDETAIGGKRLADMSRPELLAALKERLRVNIGLVAENAKLSRLIESRVNTVEPGPNARAAMRERRDGA